MTIPTKKKFVGEEISKTRASGFIRFPNAGKQWLKTIGPAASWFQMFSDETLALVFEMLTKTQSDILRSDSSYDYYYVNLVIYWFTRSAKHLQLTLLVCQWRIN